MKTIRLILMVLAACFALAACEPKGPMERAGEKIDEAATDAGNAIEDACEDIKESADAEDQDC